MGSTGVTKMALSAALIAVATQAIAAKDDFNRGTLGQHWVVSAGSLQIAGGELQGSDMAIGYDKKSQADTTVSVTVNLHGSNLEYGAVASGDIASGNNAFVKVQSSADGKIGYAAFYEGNNGAGTFFQLDAPVRTPAVLSVSFCGTVATMKIKSVDGVQKYTHDYGKVFGEGGGLGTYGPVSLDNYKSTAGGCKADAGAREASPMNIPDGTVP